MTTFSRDKLISVYALVAFILILAEIAKSLQNRIAQEFFRERNICYQKFYNNRLTYGHELCHITCDISLAFKISLNDIILLSLSFCGISNSSGDSAISTAHSQSEISSKESSPKEFRLSFVFHQAMATLEESRLNFRQSRSIFNDEDDEDSQKSYSSVNESLNLSQFSSGTSNFESGKHLVW